MKLFNRHKFWTITNIFWWGSCSTWLQGRVNNGKQMTGLSGAMRPQWVKCLNRWPVVYRATVPGTWSHTMILLSPWAFVATQWYPPASWVRTPLICRDESGSTLNPSVGAWMARPALYHVKLWRMEPSTLQDSTATAPTEEVTLTGGFRTGGGSV